MKNKTVWKGGENKKKWRNGAFSSDIRDGLIGAEQGTTEKLGLKFKFSALTLGYSHPNWMKISGITKNFAGTQM